MTNKEFYGDKLLAIALSECCIDLYVVTKGKSCADEPCSECEFSSNERILQWLNADRNDSFNENGTNITGWKYARLPEDGE